MTSESPTPFGINFSSIQQPSIVEQIIQSVKQSIINGELQPGQRLPSELELSRQLGVGRGAVREAMKVLQALGVVTIRQGDGTYIVDGTTPTMLSPLVFAILLETNTTMDLFELRRLLEIGYCELAARNATEEDWTRIEAAARALEDYAKTEQVDETVRLDLDFHYAILESTHNPLVIRIGRTVEDLFFASIRKTYLARHDNIRWAIDSHREILEAMRDGSSDKIRMAIDNSLIYWKEEV